MRGLATKTERQPFAPFQRIFQLQPSDRRQDALAARAPSNLGLAI